MAKTKLSKEYRFPNGKGGYTVYEAGKPIDIDAEHLKNIDPKDIVKDDDSKK